MSGSFAERTQTVSGTVDRNLSKIIGVASGLVAFNIALMLVLSYIPPVVGLARVLFSSILIGIVAFAVTIGGGSWVASAGTERGNLPLAIAGVALIQSGFGLFGAGALGIAPEYLRLPAIGISIVITAAITAVIGYVVFTTNYNFSSWQNYSFYCFIGGIGLAAAGVFLFTPLLLVASLLFFLGFMLSLTYEIWAVKENRYASDLRNAIGIYTAVMGVFVNVLIWVLRILELLDV